VSIFHLTLHRDSETYWADNSGQNDIILYYAVADTGQGVIDLVDEVDSKDSVAGFPEDLQILWRFCGEIGYVSTEDFKRRLATRLPAVCTDQCLK
jgi:hypothetical protein